MAAFPLGVQVEFNIDGQGWTDVTADVRTSDPIKITGGRRDESATVTPGTCAFKLNNRNGVYSDKNPLSPYFERLGRNTPLRVSVAGDAYLQMTGNQASNAGASTPTSTTLDITGDLDVRLDATLTSWSGSGSMELAGKGAFNGGDQAWLLMARDGNLHFEWSETGSGTASVDSTLPLPVPLSERLAVRVTLDVDNGSGGWTVTFYTATSIGGPWQQLGDAVTGGSTTSIHSSTGVLRIGDGWGDLGFPSADGRLHAFQLRDGIDGTLSAEVDMATQIPGAGTFTDTAGNTWTIDYGAAITDRYYRFTGEVSAWPQRWDVSGTDAWVPVQAAGVLRRYGQGAKPLQSTLRRRIPSGDPLVYWPMEDGADASRAYTPTPGGQPLVSSGLRWAADSSLAGSDALPTIGRSAWMRGPVPAGTSGSWQIEFVCRIDQGPADNSTELMRWYLGGCDLFVKMRMNVGKLDDTHLQAIIFGYDSDNNETQLFNLSLEGLYGAWTRFQLMAEPGSTSGTFDMQIGIIPIGGAGGVSTTTFNGAAGRVATIYTLFGDQLEGASLGHLAVFDAFDTRVFYNADIAFAGESSTDRLRRLAEEENLPLSVQNGPGVSEALGPQRIVTVLDNVEDIVAVDGGLLTERREIAGLLYRQRSTLYNQTPALVLDYTARGEVMPPLEPTEDDQNTRNDVTVTREGGSSARVVQETGPLNVADPPAGVGRYDTQVTLNAWADSQLPDLAGWRLHLGTWDGSRYPRVHVALHAAPHLIPAVRDLRLLDRMQILNPPPWVPPGVIDLLVEGYVETLGVYTWDLVFNCSPASPWSVGVVGDDTLGRADTDGSILAAPVEADTTTLPVRATAGPQWVTDPAEFPFDVRVAGEVVTVTGCTAAEATPLRAGTGSTTTTTDTTAVAPSVDADQAGDLLVCAWIPWDFPADAYTPPAGMARQSDTTGQWSTLTDATETTAAAGALGTRTATRTSQSAWAAVSVLAAGAPVVEEHLADIATDAGQTHSPGPVTLTTGAGTQAGWWLIAVHAYDNAAGTGSEAPTGTGWIELAVSPQGDENEPFIGAWAKTATGGAEDVVFPAGDADDNHARLYVISGVTDLTAQLMSVTRAVNGISKNQTAGADVRLAQPSIVAL